MWDCFPGGDWEDIEGFVVRSEFLPVARLPDKIRESPIHAPFLDLVFGEKNRPGNPVESDLRNVASGNQEASEST